MDVEIAFWECINCEMLNKYTNRKEGEHLLTNSTVLEERGKKDMKGGRNLHIIKPKVQGMQAYSSSVDLIHNIKLNWNSKAQPWQTVDCTHNKKARKLG